MGILNEVQYRSEESEIFKNRNARVEKGTADLKVKCVRLGNGGEYHRDCLKTDKNWT